MQAVLTSWKEIAQHMGKGVRTLQRWERELGFPVHRPLSKTKGVVLAYPAELDAWGKASRDGHSGQPTECVETLRQRNRALLGELARLAMSLHISSQQLLEHCQAGRPSNESHKQAV